MLTMAYSTILVTRHTRTVTLEMTNFPTIIARRVRVIGFKITGFIAVATKLKSFFKRIINVYIAS